MVSRTPFIRYLFRGTQPEYAFSAPLLARSAELHSAVSQDCILPGVGEVERVRICDAPPIANRRYGRVQLCATLSTCRPGWPRTLLSAYVILLAALCIHLPARGADHPLAPTNSNTSKLVSVGLGGKLHCTPYTDRGDLIPDFSNCGYGGGGVTIPEVPVKATVLPEPGSRDDTTRIQAAIDQVSKLPPGPDGFRGAVLLGRGRYRIEGALQIAASGVVLRGVGQTEDGTVLIGAGTKKRVLINLQGPSGATEVKGTRQKITSDYVPVGARSFQVTDGSAFKADDTVIVSRLGNVAWIHEIGMDRIALRAADPTSTKQWSPFALGFDRVITAVEGNRITVDAPIVCAIDARWGGAEIWRYTDHGRIERVGVENLRGLSEYDERVKLKDRGQEYFADEQHALGLASFANVKNAWARNLTAAHFYHGVSTISGSAKWITVQDCASRDPVSEITGSRRYPFSIDGQLCLVQRCTSRNARHAFVLGSRVPGPNVFLDCQSELDHATSEPHHRWSVGGLFDNVRADLAIQDRQWMGSGHGWAGANYVVWNCEGSLVCQQPPTAQNFAIGFVGKREKGAFERPAGWWESEGRHVEPRSLYRKQLEERLGRETGRPAKTADP
jgi:hypothetical protein